MSHCERIAFTLFVLTAAILDTGAVQAAADNIRYVSTAGNNANPCTLAAPCRSLQGGINQTPANGELQVLDSGNFGNKAIIAKSMTISGNGNTISVTNGITINGSESIVTLRNLVLDGQHERGIFGIEIKDAWQVHIERCLIHSVARGIVVDTAADVFVTDSIVRQTGEGLFITGMTPARLTVDNSRFMNNGGHGVVIGGGEAMIKHSVISGNEGHGLLITFGKATVTSTASVYNGYGSTPGNSGFAVANPGQLTLESSTARGNKKGLLVSGTGATAWISNSTITNNVVGIQNDGTTFTRQNNTVAGNGNDLSGTLTPLGGM